MSQLVNVANKASIETFPFLAFCDSNPSSLESRTEIAVLPILNRPGEALHLFQKEEHLAGWIATPHKTKEEIKVVGFREVANQDLLEKIHSLGTSRLCAIKQRHEVVLLPALEGGAVDDYRDVSPKFVEEFNESTLDRGDYRAKALEFLVKLREIGGLEKNPATNLQVARIGFARLAKCKDTPVLEAAMLSLYQLEQQKELDSGDGLIEALSELLKTLNPEHFAHLSPYDQGLILKTYNRLVESILSHSRPGEEMGVSRIDTSQRHLIAEQLEKVEKFAGDDQPETLYVVRLALEGNKRLLDNSTAWKVGAERLLTFCDAVQAAWDQNIPATLNHLKNLVADVELPKDWYENIYAVRKMGKAALKSKAHFHQFMQFINSKEIQKENWKVLYTVAEVLGELICNSTDSEIQMQALEGYDAEGRGKFLRGLKGFAFFDGDSTEKLNGRVRYKAAQALRNLEKHPSPQIKEKVSSYLETRKSLEEFSYVKSSLTKEFSLPEEKIEKLLAPVKQKLSLEKEPSTSKAPSSKEKAVDTAQEESPPRPSQKAPSKEEDSAASPEASPPPRKSASKKAEAEEEESAVPVPVASKSKGKAKEVAVEIEDEEDTPPVKGKKTTSKNPYLESFERRKAEEEYTLSQKREFTEELEAEKRRKEISFQQEKLFKVKNVHLDEEIQVLRDDIDLQREGHEAALEDLNLETDERKLDLNLRKQQKKEALDARKQEQAERRKQLEEKRKQLNQKRFS